MKNVFIIVIISFILAGCNMNPNKEARLQKLELKIQQTKDQIKQLESRVQTLEVNNEQLKTKVFNLENW